jgi:hypothetical protein
MKIDVYSEGSDKREHLATFIVGGIDEVSQNEIAMKNGSSKPKVQLSFELTRSGLFSLNKAEAKIDELYEVEERPTKKKANKTKNEDNVEKPKQEGEENTENPENKATEETEKTEKESKEEEEKEPEKEKEPE